MRLLVFIFYHSEFPYISARYVAPEINVKKKKEKRENTDLKWQKLSR